MNNVYVDKVPTCCDECPCCNCDIDYGESCNLGAFNHYEYYQTIYKHPKCPLKSTSQLLAEERKKVVSEIWQEFEQRLKGKTKDMSIIQVCLMINSVLDQMEVSDERLGRKSK